MLVHSLQCTWQPSALTSPLHWKNTSREFHWPLCSAKLLFYQPKWPGQTDPINLQEMNGSEEFFFTFRYKQTQWQRMRCGHSFGDSSSTNFDGKSNQSSCAFLFAFHRLVQFGNFICRRPVGKHRYKQWIQWILCVFLLCHSPVGTLSMGSEQTPYGLPNIRNTRNGHMFSAKYTQQCSLVAFCSRGGE